MNQPQRPGFSKGTSFILLIGLFVFLSSCLKTRSDLGESDQYQVYSKKNANNQNTPESQLIQKQQQVADERDELIRNLNGRVENLENQVTSLNKERVTSNAQEAQKIQILQEAMVKMEAHIQKMEVDFIQKKAALDVAAISAKSERTDVPLVSSSSAAQSVTSPAAVNARPLRRLGATKASASPSKNPNPYEVAQGFFASRDWKKAILNYQKYVDEFPRGKEVADAKYKIGVCFQELGMKEESMAFFEEVVAQYGKSEAGKKAKIRLTKLKK